MRGCIILFCNASKERGKEEAFYWGISRGNEKTLTSTAVTRSFTSQGLCVTCPYVTAWWTDSLSFHLMNMTLSFFLSFLSLYIYIYIYIYNKTKWAV